MSSHVITLALQSEQTIGTGYEASTHRYIMPLSVPVNACIMKPVWEATVQDLAYTKYRITVLALRVLLFVVAYV